MIRRTTGPRDHQSGVTLIEMMIVLVVIGVGTGAVLLGTGALVRDDRVEQEARRLAGAISLGFDAALIVGVSRSISWDAQGYQIGNADRHTLDGAVILTRSDGAGGDAVLSATATGAPFVFALSGPAGAWDVRFDGFAVSAAPGGASGGAP